VKATHLKLNTVRDVLGEPSSWDNHISDGFEGKPDMDGATILDVFVSGNQLALYTRNAVGVEALSIFFIDDQEIRARIATQLMPGLDVHKAVEARIR
jgi:hypothetical protein